MDGDLWLSCPCCGSDIHVVIAEDGSIEAIARRSCGENPYSPVCILSDGELVDRLNSDYRISNRRI